MSVSFSTLSKKFLIELSKYLIPLPIFYNAPREPMISLAKAMSKNDHSPNWIDTLPDKEKFYLAFNEDGELSTSKEINIKKQIYFLKSTLKLDERYKVNNQLQRQLGHLPDGVVIEIKKRGNNY